MIDVAMLEWDGIEQIVSALIDCLWCLRGCPCERLTLDVKQCFQPISPWQRQNAMEARPFRERVTRRPLHQELDFKSRQNYSSKVDGYHSK